MARTPPPPFMLFCARVGAVFLLAIVIHNVHEGVVAPGSQAKRELLAKTCEMPVPRWILTKAGQYKALFGSDGLKFISH